MLHWAVFYWAVLHWALPDWGCLQSRKSWHVCAFLTICGGQGERPQHLAPCLDEGHAQEGGQLVHTVQLQPVRRQAAGRHRATSRGAAEEGHGRLRQEGQRGAIINSSHIYEHIEGSEGAGVRG